MLERQEDGQEDGWTMGMMGGWQEMKNNKTSRTSASRTVGLRPGL